MASFELLPGCVVNTDRGEAYVMSPEGGIIAVDLSGGSQLWHSHDADKPLAVTGDLLVGQAEEAGPANELKIVTLQTTQGGARASEGLVRLPPGVEPMIGQTMGRTFVARAQPLEDDVAISWESIEAPTRGANIMEVEILPGEEELAETDGMPPPPGTFVQASMQQDAWSTVQRGTVRLSPADGTVTEMVEAQSERAPARAPTADEVPAMEVDARSIVSDVPEPQFLSGDGRHVMHSERIADSSQWDRYRWAVYESNNGQLIGEIQTHASYAPFVVSGRQIIFESQPYERNVDGNFVREPLQVRSYNLQSATQVWKQEVRDTVDVVPPPP